LGWGRIYYRRWASKSKLPKQTISVRNRSIDYGKRLPQPLLMRFPHLVVKQIQKLFGAFENAIKEYNYKGKFKAVFPSKVNQTPKFYPSFY